jgi:hypothetical protein
MAALLEPWGRPIPFQQDQEPGLAQLAETDLAPVVRGWVRAVLGSVRVVLGSVRVVLVLAPVVRG